VSNEAKLSEQALSCLIALLIDTHWVEEHRLLRAQVLQCHLYDVARPRQPCLSVPHDATLLESLLIEPAVQQGEVLTAVVDLFISEPDRSAVLHKRNVLLPSVPYSFKVLGQVNGGAGIVTHAEQEYLSVQVVGTADGAVLAMRNLDWMGAVISSARGPIAAKAWGLSLRRTPGERQNVSGTTPISGQGVVFGSKGLSSSEDMLGITRVPSVFSTSRNAAIRPDGQPSTGPTFENAVWTTRTPPG